MKVKGAWPCFGEIKRYFPSLRFLGHEGVAIYHHAFDRALLVSLTRKVHEMHEIRRQEECPLESGPYQHVGFFLEWVVVNGCGAHDANGAVKWATFPFAQDKKQVLRDIFIVVEPLRNSYKVLMEKRCFFLNKYVRFRTTNCTDVSDVRFFVLDVARLAPRSY